MPHSYYNTTSVLLCLGITALVCLSVTVFSFQTKVSSGVWGQDKAYGMGGSKLGSLARERGKRCVGSGEATWRRGGGGGARF